MVAVPGDFDFSILSAIEHRPWPLPDRAWVMTQTWHDLLFAHWPVDPAPLQKKLPLGLALDLFDGQAWVGVVPFRMTNVAARGLPALPGLSAFPELNVRTYVRVGGRPRDDAASARPGVYFFSLDAASRAAVFAARRLFHLPYFLAAMQIGRDAGAVRYGSRRRDPMTSPAEFQVRYRPTGPAAPPRPRSLEHFLTERYCLHTADRNGRILSVEIHHPPWPLQPAEAQIERNTMADAADITIAGPPARLHFAQRQDVVVWPSSRA